MSMTKFGRILALGRIKFLTYSPILYGLGATIATYKGEQFSAQYFVLGMITVWITHLMTHYCNEYYDFDTDSANLHPSPWTGGSRVLPLGLLEPRVSLQMAVLTLLIALSLSSAMPTILCKLICFCAVFLAWEYSAPPLYLSRRALGEVITTIVLNILTPSLGFFLQQRDHQVNKERFTLLAFVLTPLALIEFVRMMVMNLPDSEADAKVGKRTLVVRLGTQRAKYVHFLGMISAYAIAFSLLFLDVPLLVTVLLLFSAPLGFLTTWWVYHYVEHRDLFFTVPWWASTHNAISSLFPLIGFALIHHQQQGSTSRMLFHLKFFAMYLYPCVFVYFMFIHPRIASRNVKKET